jgi:hypothetical protein
MQNWRKLIENLNTLPLPNRLIALVGIGLFLGMGLKFIPLYSLWDDEANTALFAQSVHETGDTTAIRGNNEIAYRNGAELNAEKKARYVSPLQYYFLAPFMDAHTPNPAAARLPFFWLSLLALVLIYGRALQLNLPSPLLVQLLFLTVGLSAFFLFSLQCRYYALCLFWSAGLAEIYFFRDWNRTRNFLWFGVFGALLFVSNYLVGLAALTCLFLHAIIFRRSALKMNLAKWSALTIPQLLISLPVFLIWNPLGKNVVALHNSPLDRLNLFYRNVRDFNGGHFGSLLILLAGVCFLKGAARNRFKQYGLIFLTYLAVIAAFSPQPVHGSGVADIRYLYPLTLLAFAWMLDLGGQILKKSTPAFWVYACFFSFCSLPYSAQLQFPLLNLAHEYAHRADDPYRTVADWLQQNAGARANIESSVDYATYPLMYLAPQFHYLGQRTNETEVPDYLVSFCEDGIVAQAAAKNGMKYQEVAHFEMSCREKFRPEIFLRSFGRNATGEMIRIFKKI